MIKQSVCIDMFWEKELSDEDKIRQVASLGVSAFEFWGWKNKDLDKLSAVIKETGITLSTFCAEFSSTMTTFTDEALLAEEMKKSIEVAKSLACKSLIVCSGNEVEGEEYEVTMERVIRGLKVVSEVAKEAGITLVLEPLNVLVDHAGNFLTTTAEAVRIIEAVGLPNLKILFDIYHQQVTEGNITDKITKNLSMIGHFHAAGVPGRHELVGGELAYENIFALIDSSDYEGYVGLEFEPTKPSREALEEAISLAKI